MPTRALLVPAAAAASLLVAMADAHAGPTVVRDEMLRDTAVTPVLGRGYSLSTNTFQSICLTDIAKTKPSYDFHYTFAELDNKGVRKTDIVAGVEGTFFKRNLGVVDVDVSGDAKYTDNDKVEWHRFHILVTIDVDAYYASVDESRARLAPAAATLLDANDTPGFFDACGMYYTRSISRRSTFVSVISYEQRDSTRDQHFEATLKAKIKAFGTDVSDLTFKTDTKFHDEMHDKRTTIVSHAFGLGKDEKANLIASDLVTYKAAIASAFVAMQNDDVGMVTAIEVVPWVENPQFQGQLKLGPREIDKPGSTTGEKLAVSPYAQKRILSQNAEFLSELDRAARGKLNVFYKAKQCRERVQFDYMVDDDDGGWSFGPINPEAPEAGTWAAQPIVNNRTGGRPIPLSQLYATMTDAKLGLIFAEYESFMYGGTEAPVGVGDPGQRGQAARVAFSLGKYPSDLFPGVTTCVTDLLAAGFSVRSYRTVPTCQHIEETFAVVSGQVVDDYCMPTRAR